MCMLCNELTWDSVCGISGEDSNSALIVSSCIFDESSSTWRIYVRSSWGRLNTGGFIPTPHRRTMRSRNTSSRTRATRRARTLERKAPLMASLCILAILISRRLIKSGQTLTHSESVKLSWEWCNIVVVHYIVRTIVSNVFREVAWERLIDGCKHWTMNGITPQSQHVSPKEQHFE